MASGILRRESGRRATTQRQLLLEILQEAKGHLDADELYRRARQRQPVLSLSTVYRSLQVFEELGLVKKHQFDSTRWHYELRSETTHYHLVCLGCGRILEFHCPSAKRLRSSLSKQKGFKVINAEAYLEGYCLKCQKKLLSDKTDNKAKHQVEKGGE